MHGREGSLSVCLTPGDFKVGAVKGLGLCPRGLTFLFHSDMDAWDDDGTARKSEDSNQFISRDPIKYIAP